MPSNPIWGAASANSTHMWYFGGTMNGPTLWQYEFATDIWKLLSNVDT
jgi:hypothetical protein